MSNGLSGLDMRSSKPRGGATGRYLPWSSTNPTVRPGLVVPDMVVLAGLVAAASFTAVGAAGAAAPARPGTRADAAAKGRPRRPPPAGVRRIPAMLLSSPCVGLPSPDTPPGTVRMGRATAPAAGQRVAAGWQRIAQEVG